MTPCTEHDFVEIAKIDPARNAGYNRLEECRACGTQTKSWTKAWTVRQPKRDDPWTD